MVVSSNDQGATKPPARRIVPVVYAGVTLLFAGGVVLPAVFQVRKLNAQIMHKKAAVKQALARRRQLRRTTVAVAALRRQLAPDRLLVPRRLRRGRFLRALNHCRSGAGFAVATVQSGASKRLKHCQTLPINIRGSGTAEELCRFLRAVEFLPRKCWIMNLSIKADPKMSGQVMANIQCALYASAR